MTAIEQPPSKKWVGQALRRKEDPRMITGRGRYVDDMVVPGMLYMAVVRSPEAHAKILSIDASEALARPGIKAVFTGEDMSDLLAQHAPLLKHAASYVGDPQVRHRGTIGGSIAHADPASDLPATTLALGATYVAQGPGGTREIAAADFYESFLTSALAADELLTEIRIPKMAGAGWSFQKFNRRAQDWAIVGVAAWRRNGDAGVGLVNMGSTPILATSVSSALSSGASVEDAAEQAVAEADPQADLNASVEYRTHLAKVLTRRALEAAGG